jgi:hypothetical protein
VKVAWVLIIMAILNICDDQFKALEALYEEQAYLYPSDVTHYGLPSRSRQLMESQSSSFADLARSISQEVNSPVVAPRATLEAEFPGMLDTAEFHFFQTDEYLSPRTAQPEASSKPVKEVFSASSIQLHFPSELVGAVKTEEYMSPTSDRLRIPTEEEFYTFRKHSKVAEGSEDRPLLRSFLDDDPEERPLPRPLTPPQHVFSIEVARAAMQAWHKYTANSARALLSRAAEIYRKDSEVSTQRKILKAWRRETAWGERAAVFRFYYKNALTKRVFSKLRFTASTARTSRVAAARQRNVWLKRNTLHEWLNLKRSTKENATQQLLTQAHIRRKFLKKILKTWLYFVRPSAQYLRESPVKQQKVCRDVDLLLRRIEVSERKISSLWVSFRRKSKSVRCTNPLGRKTPMHR